MTAAEAFKFYKYISDLNGNTDEHSRPELIGIIENAIDDLNEETL